jgi:UDP-2,4-diacetamido-2,4,6-trideoxy-beta-L-altropyranose hydrolase
MANNMKIAIRVDSSSEIGTGHVVRCLTLANELKLNDVTVWFLCRRLSGDITSSIEASGFQVMTLGKREGEDSGDFSSHYCENDAQQVAEFCLSLAIDLVILDHYFLDLEWERAVKQHCKLMCISDFPSRPRACDMLLDQSLYRVEDDYRFLVEDSCMLTLGSDYAVVRPDFAKRRRDPSRKIAASEVARVLITMGGSDPEDYTTRIIDFLCRYHSHDLSKISFDIVLGRSYQHSERVADMVSTANIRFSILGYVDDMAGLMSGMDLIITSGGTTLWECFTLGVPAIAVQIADNQRYNIESCSRAEAIIACGSLATLDLCLEQALANILETKGVRTKLQKNGLAICDGLGVKRVVTKIAEAVYACHVT